MPKAERRRFLLAALDLGMTSGDYVFFTFDVLPDEGEALNGRIVPLWVGNDGRDKDVLRAFESVFHVCI
jgi:hypothetical protein